MLPSHSSSLHTQDSIWQLRGPFWLLTVVAFVDGCVAMTVCVFLFLFVVLCLRWYFCVWVFICLRLILATFLAVHVCNFLSCVCPCVSFLVLCLAMRVISCSCLFCATFACVSVWFDCCCVKWLRALMKLLNSPRKAQQHSTLYTPTPHTHTHMHTSPLHSLSWKGIKRFQLGCLCLWCVSLKLY